MAMTNDDGGGFVFVNFDTGTVDPVGGESYIVNIGQLDPTEADTLNGCEDWGVYSPEARAIVARHGVRVADLVRPGETGGGGSELGSGGHPEPVRAEGGDVDTCGICSERVAHCCCWRCMTCENLFADDVESEKDDDGETICRECVAEFTDILPDDDFRLGEWVRFVVGGDGEELTGHIVGVNVDEINGLKIGTYDEPIHLVSVDESGAWAIHPSWITFRGVIG